jgi:neutral ceramidase
MTLLAGVQDGGPTPVRNWLPFFREGSRRWIFTGGCQGDRRIFAGPFQSLILPRSDFPHAITYQVVQVGDVLLLPLPYEITMESGRRIVETCKKSALASGMDANSRFEVISVSNGYTGYCAAPEEYGEQRHEAGHTIYGPNTNAFIVAQTAKIVADLARNGQVRDMPKERSFRLTEETFYRNYKTSAGSRVTVKEPVLRKAQGEEEYWAFNWADVPPSLIDLHRRLISIEYNDGTAWLPVVNDGILVDDDGYDISESFSGETMLRTNLGIYETRWQNPEGKEG